MGSEGQVEGLGTSLLPEMGESSLSPESLCREQESCWAQINFTTTGLCFLLPPVPALHPQVGGASKCHQASLFTTEPLLGLMTFLRVKNTPFPFPTHLLPQVSPLIFSPCPIFRHFTHSAFCLEHSSSLWSQSEDHLLQEASPDSLDRICTFRLVTMPPSGGCWAGTVSFLPLSKTQSSNHCLLCM